jgi:hypothetical protein
MQGFQIGGTDLFDKSKRSSANCEPDVAQPDPTTSQTRLSGARSEVEKITLFQIVMPNSDKHR